MHIGEKNDKENPDKVDYVQADGDELELAIALSGRPHNGKKVMWFFGDDARHIVANWY
jgi:uroporphyrinogen-III synthase